MRRSLKAPSAEGVIFLRGTTEAIERATPSFRARRGGSRAATGVAFFRR
jgi:hypothetical protein